MVHRNVEPSGNLVTGLNPTDAFLAISKGVIINKYQNIGYCY